LGAAALPRAASAQSWPNRPIQLVVHFPAGGIADVGARALGDGLASLLGQPLVIDNRPGGGGLIGANLVAKAKPDGHTLLFATNSPLSFAPITHPNMPYDPVKDLVPIVPVASYSLQVVVNNALPIHSVADLIDYAKKHPGKLNYASPGIGSGIHFAVEHFKHVTGIQLTHVPYKGSSQLMTDLAGGYVQVTFDGAARSHIEAGRVRLIATTGPERDPRFPQTPTVHEAGVEGYKFVASQVLLGPRDLPQELVDRLNTASNEVLKDPKVRAYLAEQGLIVTGGSPKLITQEIIEGIAENRRIATAAKLVFE